ncbi:hypothetical protein ABPG72_007867 [Tetrahymena utriculariae]
MQANTGFYGNYIYNNYLKIPKTNILIAVSVQYSGNQVAHTILYFDDISKTQDNILEVVKTEFEVVQLYYIEAQKKFIVSNQSQVLIIDPYSIKPIKQMSYSLILGMTYIKEYDLIFICSNVCECFVVEINYFKTLFRFNNCQYDSTSLDAYIFSKAYKQNNGIILLVLQDFKGLCTWSFQVSKGIYQYNYHFQLTNGFLNSINNYETHDDYNILFIAGNNSLLLVYEICHFCSNQSPYKLLSNQTLIGTNIKFYYIKYIKVNISGEQIQSIFLSDLNFLYRFDFQVITNPSTNQVQSLLFLNLQNPLKVIMQGNQFSQAFWYFLEENQQLLISVSDFQDSQKALTYVYNYNTNTGQIRHYYKTNGYTKLFRFQLQNNYYFISLLNNLITITQESLQGDIIQQFNIMNNGYPGNSFFSVYNNPLCYIIIQTRNYIKLYKSSLDNKNGFANYLSLYFLGLNIQSEMYKPVAFYQRNNDQDQVWVVLGLPVKNNNQNFLFHIVDLWNFQFKVLVSDNPDDNINNTCFALYSDLSQEIIGLDVKGNVYVWDAKNFTNFKYKATITQYTCLNPLTATMRYDINGIYLIVECEDFQVISFNLLSGKTQLITKLSSIQDVIYFIEDIQLLLTYDFSSGAITIFKFKISAFETQILWMQYFYANIYFEIGKCANETSPCMNCSMDFYFNTNEKKQISLNYGLGTSDSPFVTSSSLITAFYNAKQYQQLLTEVKSINLNIYIDPSNPMNLIQELIQIGFGSNINLNFKNLNSSQKGLINIIDIIQFSNYQSVTLDNLLLNFQSSANNSQQACGVFLNNIKDSTLHNLDYFSSNSSINCFQIQIYNSTTTISNVTLVNKDFSNTSQLVTVENSNKIYFRNFQLLNSTLNNLLSILNQKSDAQLIIDNMIIQNNNCSSYYINPPQQVGQLFQAGLSQVTNMQIINNSFCNQKIFTTIGNINQKNQEFIFTNITIQQNQFYTQAPYLFFDAIYYFNAVPQHSLFVSNFVSSENTYSAQIKGQQTIFETSSLFFTNQISSITFQNVTVYNQYEISFCIVQFSSFVNLYNLTYQNDQVFQDKRNANKFDGFIQFSEIQSFNLELMKVSNIRAIDNSIISITTQQYQDSNMKLKNVEVFNSKFNQTKSNSPVSSIYITSQYYSNISIYQCSFQDNQLSGLINSQIQSTTALQIINPLGDTQILEIQFTNSKSNSIFNFVYLQCNYIFINKCTFKNSSYDLQDSIAQFKQEGGSIRAKANKIIINDTQFINSTANKGSFMYIESLASNLNLQLNQTSFTQGYSNLKGSALYIDSQNSDLLFNCSQCNFSDIYSFSKDSEAISIKYTDTQISSQTNTILFQKAYLTNILGQENNFFINSANSITQFQNIQQTQTQNLNFPQQFTNQILNLQSQALIQAQSSNVTISKSVFSNLYNLPNSMSPLFINSTSSAINMIDLIIQQCKFSQSLINFGLGQLIIQRSQFLNNSQVNQSRLLQNLKSNSLYQNNSQIKIENSKLLITDNTLFENIQCYQNCFGSSIYMINSSFQINKAKFINSKAAGGGAIFIQSLRSDENQIANSYFISNQAIIDGGALYIHGNQGDQFQLKIVSTVFNDNLSYQGSGGAVFITSDSNNSTQQSIFIKNSILQNNQAQIGGAIQNFGINPFYESNTIFMENIGERVSQEQVNISAHNAEILNKIYGSFFQIISFVSSFNLSIKSDLLDIISSIGVPISNSVDYLDCILTYSSTKISIIYLKLIISLQIVIIVLIIYALWQKIYQVIKKYNKYDIHSIYTAFIFLFMFLQPDLVSQMIGLISCREVGKTSYVLINMNYKCNTDDHKFYSSILVIPLLIIWVFLIPSILFYQVFQYRKNLGLDTIKVNLKYGYLFKEYQKNVYYWEFIKINQKIFIIIILSFFSQNPAIKGILSYFVISLYDYLARKLNPYSLKQLNNIDNYSTKVCANTLLLCIFQSYTQQKYLQIICFVIIITLNSWFVFYIIFKVLQQKIDFIHKLAQNSKCLNNILKKCNCFKASHKVVKTEVKLKIKNLLLILSSMNQDQKNQLFMHSLNYQNTIQTCIIPHFNKYAKTNSSKIQAFYQTQSLYDNRIKSINSPISQTCLLNAEVPKSPLGLKHAQLDSMKERIEEEEQINKNQFAFQNQIGQTPQKYLNIEIQSLASSDQNQYIFQLDQVDENSRKTNQKNLLDQASLNQDQDQMNNKFILPLNNTQSIKGFQKNKNQVISQDLKKDELIIIDIQKQINKQQNQQNPFNIFSKIEQLQADNDDAITISQKLETEKQE